MNEAPIHAIQPILGYLTAGASTVVMWVANTAESLPVSKGWIELGGTIGLIGGLSYGCVTLWKSLQDQRKEFRASEEAREVRMAAERKEFIAAKDALEKEIRSDWKDQNTRLVAVLERLESTDK